MEPYGVPGSFVHFKCIAHLTLSWASYDYYPHFTGEKMKAQGGKETYSRPHNYEIIELWFAPK